MRRKNKKNYGGMLIAIFFALIMITSIVGYIFSDTSNQSRKYNGVKFLSTSSGWRATYEGNIYTFSYTPSDVETLDVPDLTNLKNAAQIDLTYDFNSSYVEGMAQSSFELGSALSTSGIFIRQGLIKNNTYDVPILTCKDATQFVPVILFEESNKTEVVFENNCYIIKSNNENSFLPYTYRILYELLGIIE